MQASPGGNPFFQSPEPFLDAHYLGRVPHRGSTGGRKTGQGRTLASRSPKEGGGVSLFLVPGQLPGCETDWFPLPVRRRQQGLRWMVTLQDHLQSAMSVCAPESRNR